MTTETDPPVANGSSVSLVFMDSAYELVGLSGRLTLSIPAGGPGQVRLAIRGTTEVFAAWADRPLPRNTRVLVIDQISARSVHVTPVL